MSTMLKTIVVVFSVFACLALISVKEENLPGSVAYGAISRIMQPTDRIPENPTEMMASSSETVIPTAEITKTQLWMTTFVPTQMARSAKLSEEFLRNFYSQQAGERSRQLKGISPTQAYDTLYNVLVPEVYCPDLVRVGSVNDGGKWVCNPKKIPQENCSIYSLGLRGEISFDRDLQWFNNYSCKIYGYDINQQIPGIVDGYKAINGEVYAMTIAASTDLVRRQSTLGDLLRSHGDKNIEFLKMDIEGAEYETLPAFLDSYKPCQIFLEMHGTAYQMHNLLVIIARNNYYLFSYEVNGNNLAACEYSFIHAECMDRYGTFILAPYLNNSATF